MNQPKKYKRDVIGNCYKCKLPVYSKENYLKMTTYNAEEIIQEALFHMPCWGDYNQERVNARISEMTNVGMKLLKQGGMMA